MPPRHGTRATITSNGFVCLRCSLRGYSSPPFLSLRHYPPLTSLTTLPDHRLRTPRYFFSTSRAASASKKPSPTSPSLKTYSERDSSSKQNVTPKEKSDPRKSKSKRKTKRKPRKTRRAHPLVRRVTSKSFRVKRVCARERQRTHPTTPGEPQAGSKSKKEPSVAQASRNATGPSAATWLRNILKKLPNGDNLPEDDHCFEPRKLKLAVVDAQVAPAPRLAFGLERVLFNPGVYHLRDIHSRVYNFDPWLEKIPDIKTFDFKTLNPFTPPSQDRKLVEVAKTEKKKYFGSTSSMTGILKQFHFLLSNFRLLDLSNISRSTAIPQEPTFTRITTAPDAVFLRRTGDGVYAIDADKMFDNPNVLSLMGTYMETFFTTTKEQFSRHLHGSSNPIRTEERGGHDSFHYSTLGDMVMRSQLDAHDPRLPGAGIFDLKTRAVLPIRMQSADYEWGMDYELYKQHGDYFSFEREFVDMCRSTLLKYSLQVRMGRMDGIFVAFHNIARVFGFQYIPLHQIDKVIHGQEDPVLGDQEFKASLKLVNDVFNIATERFPDTNLRLHFDSTTRRTCLKIFVEPVNDDEIKAVQERNKKQILKFEAAVLGLEMADEDIGDENASRSHTPRSPAGATSSPKHPLEDKSDLAIGFDFDDLDRLRPIEKIGTTLSESIGRSTKPKDPATKESHKEVMGLKLYAASTVNDSIVEQPENLNQNDVWKIFSKIEVMSPEDARAGYEDTLKRRQTRFESGANHNGADHAFINLLKARTAESKEWRKAKDKLDEQAGHNLNKRMWDDELYPGDEDQMTFDELVEFKEDMEYLLNPARLVVHGRNALANSHSLQQEVRAFFQRLKPRKVTKAKSTKL